MRNSTLKQLEESEIIKSADTLMDDIPVNLRLKETSKLYINLLCDFLETETDYIIGQQRIKGKYSNLISKFRKFAKEDL